MIKNNWKKNYLRATNFNEQTFFEVFIGIISKQKKKSKQKETAKNVCDHISKLNLLVLIK